MTVPDTVLLYVFPALMIAAAVSDLLTMRIPNLLVLGTGVAFVIVAPLAGLGLATMGMHLVAALLVLAVTFGLFAAGWIGGGDAKFAAAAALWVGFELLLPYLLIAGVAGGLLTLVLLLARRFSLPARLVTVGWIDRLHQPKTGVPYGIALAAAGLLIYAQTDIHAALTALPALGGTEGDLFEQLQTF
ncbi:A24 family peptidase [Pelagibacterium montanilacus]|uniref:A24 family peptidase n=1 Tax=Pelagibacterium montanilacus TaxID=2185280 RepID=UPI000F8E7CF0|nr:prepilin peptidase [Pelagibacterium montanilacus]